MIEGKNLESQLDIQMIYNKGRRTLSLDQQHNRNMINLLKHAQVLADGLQSSTLKNGQVYSKYHRLFKVQLLKL